MNMVDFEYDGELLSDYGCMICSFDSSQDTVEIANKISVNNVKTPNAEKHMAVTSTYEEPLTFPFSICPSYSCGDDGSITGDIEGLSDEQINEIMRWLNRRGYYKFSPVYDDESFEDVFFYGTFNAELVKFGDIVAGFNLTLQTNAPYGFIDMPTKKHTFDNDSLTYIDVSDEVGITYADATIKCLEAGDFIIKNSLDPNNNVIIKNCSVNEVITLKGEQKIITTSEESHRTLCNDFNYHYIRMRNTYSNNKNIFTSNLKCELSIDYTPIRKVGIIL